MPKWHSFISFLCQSAYGEKAAIKQEQSDTCIGYAEREQSRNVVSNHPNHLYMYVRFVGFVGFLLEEHSFISYLY